VGLWIVRAAAVSGGLEIFFVKMVIFCNRITGLAMYVFT
jgi:hypothetical protein